MSFVIEKQMNSYKYIYYWIWISKYLFSLLWSLSRNIEESSAHCKNDLKTDLSDQWSMRWIRWNKKYGPFSCESPTFPKKSINLSSLTFVDTLTTMWCASGFIHLYLSAMINYIPRCSSCFDDYGMYYVCQYQGATVDLKLSKIPFIRFIL